MQNLKDALLKLSKDYNLKHMALVGQLRAQVGIPADALQTLGEMSEIVGGLASVVQEEKASKPAIPTNAPPV